MRGTPQQSYGVSAHTPVVARAIAREAREREDWQEAERFERIAARAEARLTGTPVRTVDTLAAAD